MKPKHSGHSKASAERVVKDTRRATRRRFSAEDNIRIMLDGLRWEQIFAVDTGTEFPKPHQLRNRTRSEHYQRNLLRRPL
jgi:hypothetical protein